jgi:hypothetical protein
MNNSTVSQLDYQYCIFQSLPCRIDVIKHPNEHDGKSTSIHAAIVAPEMVKIYTFPSFPDYSIEDGVSHL